jgi:hypothetical protein
VSEDPEDVRELLEAERLYFGDLHLLASALSEEVAYLTVHQQGRHDAEGEDGPDHCS